MLRDYTLERPTGADTYALHQHIEALTEGHPRPLWRADAHSVLVRTEAALPSAGVPLEEFGAGLCLFELTAAVARRKGRSTVYPASRDRRSRELWLEAEASKHGFELVSVRIRGQKDVIEDRKRSFALDETSFIGVLRVIEPEKFNRALRRGIGRVGKAYGRGLMTVERIT